jgi:hypothetical protein
LGYYTMSERLHQLSVIEASCPGSMARSVSLICKKPVQRGRFHQVISRTCEDLVDTQGSPGSSTGTFDQASLRTSFPFGIRGDGSGPFGVGSVSMSGVSPPTPKTEDASKPLHVRKYIPAKSLDATQQGSSLQHMDAHMDIQDT